MTELILGLIFLATNRWSFHRRLIDGACFNTREIVNLKQLWLLARSRRYIKYRPPGMLPHPVVFYPAPRQIEIQTTQPTTCIIFQSNVKRMRIKGPKTDKNAFGLQ